MAVTTIFLVIPLAFIATILWSFIFIKMIRRRFTPAKRVYKILLEFAKIILLFCLLIFFTVVGMLFIGILGIPILFVLIIIGIIFVTRLCVKNNQTVNSKFFIRLGYNSVLLIAIIAIPAYILAFVVIGESEITKTRYTSKEEDYVFNDLVRINVQMKNSGKPEEVTTRKFPYTKHIRTIYPDEYTLQVAYHFESDDIKKITISNYTLITQDVRQSLLEKDFDIFGGVFYKDLNTSKTSDTELTDLEVQEFKDTRQMSLNRNENEVINCIICNYDMIQIDSTINEKIIFEYSIDLLMNNGEMHTISDTTEFYKGS